MADPNWLYSSTAQSAAAIVAIVGGFITSRLLGLSAERGTLQNEWAAKQSKLRTLQGQHDELGDELQRIEAWSGGLSRLWLLDYDETFPELASVMAKNRDLEDLDPRIVNEYYNNLRTTHEGVQAFLRVNGDIITHEDEDLSEWLSRNALSAAGLDKELLQRAFRKVGDAKREQRKTAYQRMTESLRVPIGMSFSDHKLTVDPKDKIEEQRTSLAAQIELLESEVLHLSGRLDAFSYPTSIWWGLGVLAYLAVGGVVVPLAMLPADVHHEALKRIVLALFSSGVFALFLYIAVQMVALRKGLRGS